jgi:tRNA U34 2-thiouridine synthase MnmA/TrmU
MQKLGFTVIPVFFSAPYFPSAKAAHSAQDNDIDLRIIDISKKALDILKNLAMAMVDFNPCIDCHAQMIQFAGDLLSEYNAEFIITGEVLGQRPMSQNRKSLQIVSEISSYGDLLVRPLCQQHLPDTLPIREQWVDKNDLLSFSGRSRKPQIQLAKELGITLYPTPGGGCLLTNVNYSLRLADLLEYSDGTNRELELLKYGRHFRLSNQLKLVLGRFDTRISAL